MNFWDWPIKPDDGEPDLLGAARVVFNGFLIGNLGMLAVAVVILILRGMMR